MLTRFVKRFVLWLVLSLPVGILAGAGLAAYYGENANIDRLTSAVNGALSGGGIAIVGAWTAAATTSITHDRLQRAGGSEVLTGAVVSYGLILVALLLLLVAG